MRTAPEARPAWERAIEDDAGLFGLILLDGDAVIGYMHTAAPRFLPRVACLPAGPPSADAYVLMCAYFHDEEYLRGFQFLLQEVAAALKGQGVPALEVFARRHSPNTAPLCGYIRDVNLFQRDVLEGAGFRVVRVCGEIARLRLDLGTLVDAPRRSARWELRADGGMAAQPT